MHGEAIGVGQSPLVAASYLGVAAVLIACARAASLGRAPMPASAVHAPGAAD
jgi:AGZA family xanthine/uracil permease-like MFS transporter